MFEVRLSLYAKNSYLNAIRALIDAGSGGGKIKVYQGPRPDTPDKSAAKNMLLATLRFSHICAPPAIDGELIFSEIHDDLIPMVNGEASFARITDSNENVVMDMQVGLNGSGAALEFDNILIQVGHPVRITSGRLIA